MGPAFPQAMGMSLYSVRYSSVLCFIPFKTAGLIQAVSVPSLHGINPLALLTPAMIPSLTMKHQFPVSFHKLAYTSRVDLRRKLFPLSIAPENTKKNVSYDYSFLHHLFSILSPVFFLSFSVLAVL